MPYGYYRTITIDHTKVPGNLVGHPFLFNTIHNDLRTVGNGGHVVSASGYDIVFSPNTDGTEKYPHEIEKYVAGTGELVAHVKIPAISSSVPTVFYVCYGDPDVSTSREDITGVWDSDFEMVLHLGGTDAVGCLDSTVNNNDVTGDAGTPDYQQAGQVGYCVGFDGAAELLNIADSASLDITSGITLEAWVKQDIAGAEFILSKRVIASDDAYFLSTDGNGKPGLTVLIGNVTKATPKNSVLGTVAFRYVVGTYTGAALFLYLDGVQDATLGSVTGNIDTTVDPVRVGWGYDDPFSWDGRIDEVRISSIGRSTDYITATYNNQDSPSTFYALQAAEQLARSPSSGVTLSACLGIV